MSDKGEQVNRVYWLKRTQTLEDTVATLQRELAEAKAENEALKIQAAIDARTMITAHEEIVRLRTENASLNSWQESIRAEIGEPPIAPKGGSHEAG